MSVKGDTCMANVDDDPSPCVCVCVCVCVCDSWVHDGHNVLQSAAGHDRHRARPRDASVQSCRQETQRLLNELHVRCATPRPLRPQCCYLLVVLSHSNHASKPRHYRPPTTAKNQLLILWKMTDDSLLLSFNPII